MIMPFAPRHPVQIFYEQYGRGTPIVFLHPLSTNRYVWIHQLFAFARDHRVLAIDQRGHGQSDKPAEGASVDELALDVLAVLDHAKVDRAVLVGNSIGGMVAVQTALTAPARVLGLVLVSTGTHVARDVGPQVFRAYEERFEAAFAFMLRGATAAATQRARPEVGAFMADVVRVADNFTADTFLASLRDPRGLFHWDASALLPTLRQPTLLLAGEEDQAMPLTATQRLADGIPGARLEVVPGVGHFYPLERPADFNARVRAFLAELSAHGRAGRQT
jgi:pimeloyl-ACP methyl ester carboxylesterase